MQFLRLQGAPVQVVGAIGVPGEGPEEGRAGDGGAGAGERKGVAASTADGVVAQVGRGWRLCLVLGC